jgi:hypothetical protein
MSIRYFKTNMFELILKGRNKKQGESRRRTGQIFNVPRNKLAPLAHMHNYKQCCGSGMIFYRIRVRIRILLFSWFRIRRLFREFFLKKKEFIFLNWTFLLRNFQICSFFQKSFTSNSFRIRGCPDPELFYPDSYPDPDPAKSFGSDTTLVINPPQHPFRPPASINWHTNRTTTDYLGLFLFFTQAFCLQYTMSLCWLYEEKT